MSEIVTFFYNNFWLCSGFVGVLIIYLAFEANQRKNAAQSVSAQEAIQLTGHEKGRFVDLRGEKAYQNGHITGAICTSADNLKQGTKALQKYKERPVILYGDDSYSARQCQRLLSEQGFSKVYILKGGLQQWRAENMPVETGAPATAEKGKSKGGGKKSSTATTHGRNKTASASRKRKTPANTRRLENNPTAGQQDKGVEIYTKQGCPFCTRALELLDQKQVNYKQHDIGRNPQHKQKMTERANGRTTVPQIFINGEGIGGCDELHELEEQGKLDAMLSPYRQTQGDHHE